MGTARRLAEEVGRALKTALPTLRKTVVDKAALAVGGFFHAGNLPLFSHVGDPQDHFASAL